jgi:hypothetical protein
VNVPADRNASSTVGTQPATERPDPIDLALLALSAVVMAVLPWTIAYWPGQDTPNNLAIAHILGRLGEAGNPFEAFFTADLTFKPYVAQHVATLALGNLVGLVTADRVVTSTLIIAFPAALWLLNRSIAPGRWQSTALMVPLASSWFLFKGFYGFLMAAYAGLIAVALYWDAADRNGRSAWIRLVGASILMLTSALAHPIVPGLLLIALVLKELPSLFRSGTFVRLTAVAVPVTLMMLGSFANWFVSQIAASDLESSVEYAGFFRSLWNLIDSHSVTLSQWELAIRGVIVLTLLIAAGRKLVVTGLSGMGVDQSIGRLIVGFVLLYLALPTHAWTGHIAARAGFFLVIWCSLAADLPSWMTSGRRIGWSVLIACIGLTALQRYEGGRESRQMESMISLESRIRQGATLLPVFFKFGVTSGSVSPLLHAWGYMTVRRDAVTPYVFAFEGFRPLLYRDGERQRRLPSPGEGAAASALKMCPGNLSGELREDCVIRRRNTYREVLDTAAAYDHVLVFKPPPEFVELARSRFFRIERSGDWWLLTT